MSLVTDLIAYPAVGNSRLWTVSQGFRIPYTTSSAFDLCTRTDRVGPTALTGPVYQIRPIQITIGALVVAAGNAAH